MNPSRAKLWRWSVAHAVVHGISVIALCGVLSCGSQEDSDKKELDGPATSPTPGPIEPKNPGNGDSLRPPLHPPPVSNPESPLTCSAELGVETEVNPELNAGVKTLLVGYVDPDCFNGRIPVLWLHVTKGFRIQDAMTCARSDELPNYNYKCTGYAGQFAAGDHIIIPVTLDASDVATFRAEIELIPPQATNF